MVETGVGLCGPLSMNPFMLKPDGKTMWVLTVKSISSKKLVGIRH
jgi:hypothetical protein